jgi:hypothetical protein
MSRARWILPLAAVCAFLVPGCSGVKGGNTSTHAATGTCAPTCGGRAPAAFEDYRKAKAAFTRSSRDGVLNATLEDVAWLRFEGSPDEVEKNHRAYFEYGYTSFQVTLRAHEFTRPTDESFVLQDGRGARIVGKPISFQGGMQTVDDRWQFTFELSFQHALGTDCQWIKLTRVLDGESVEWRFTPGTAQVATR